MNYNKLRILPLLAAVILASAAPAAGQTTRKLSANKSNEYGLIYSLPLTEIDVTVEVENRTETPGEFYQYSKKLLSLDPIITPSTRWTLKRVMLSAKGVADKNERYLVQFKAGSTPFVIINDQNFPVSVNTEQKFTVQESAPIEMRLAEPTILETSAAKQAVTEDMLRSNSTPKRAELAAARILELRQQRSEVISGQAESMPGDGAAMKLALDNLNSQEAALTAMFTGTVQTSTEVATYTFRPDSLDNARVVIARLSALDGLVDADNLSGAPIYLDYNVTERGTLPINEKGETKRYPKGGMAYRIPGTAQIAVTYEGETFAKETLQVAQAGVVFGLDPGLFTDKKAPAAAVFNPVTGAIVELSTVAPAAQP